VAFRQQTVAEMRTNKAGGAGNHDAQLPSKLSILTEPVSIRVIHSNRVI
jgi:hypothetical protein